MGTRAKVIVAVGLVVLVGVAGVGVRAWMRADVYPKGWEDKVIHGLAIGPDRRTLSIRSDDVNTSCEEARAEVDEGDQEWTVHLEARKTQQFCLVGACIGPRPRAGPAPTLEPGEQLDCTTLTITLDRAVPDDVEVVAR